MDGKSLDTTAEKIAQLRQLFPEVFSEDKIDFQRLKQALGEDTYVKGEHYELSWAGKSEARKEIQKQTTATLIPDRENSIDFDNAQNIFIEGENLEVLRVLQKSYFGKVKMIYIDPPYNTGNDSFVYPDDYAEKQEEYKKRTGISNEEGFLNKQDLWKKNTKENGQFHSVWLSMMYPRLYLSRNLLREDGVIFISIDDNEAANLKLLCDEVFGEENFVCQVVWRKKYGLQNDAKYFSISHEYLLCYSKNKELFKPFLLDRNEEQNNRYKNPDEDIRGVWKAADLSVGRETEKDRYEIITPSGRVITPPKGRSWVVSKTKFQELVEDNRIWFGENGNNVPSVKKFLTEVKQGITPSTFWDYDEVGHTDSSNKKLKELFDDRAFFDYPKPTELLKKAISIGADDNSLILDFFAGSGTTAQAVMELNEADGGNRKYICVQMPEATDEKSEAYKAGYKTIADITRARIQKVIEKITKARASKMDFDNKPLPVCQNYTLAPSNFKSWRGDVEGKEAIAQQLLDFTESQKQGSQAANMLVELCLKSGLGLNVAYNKENGFYKTNRGIWFCFETYTTAMKNEIIAAKPQKLVCLNSCFTSDEVLSNLQLELTENGITFLIV